MAYDAASEPAKTAQAAVAAATLPRLARPEERVAELNRVGELLLEQLFEWGVTDEGELTRHNLWLWELKQIGSGPLADKGWTRRFNSGILGRLLDVFKALAEETGGRVKPAPGAGDTRPGAEPADPDLSGLTDQELDILDQLLRKIHPAADLPPAA